jgi:Sec-independent protein translocase protein TatA
MLDISPEKLLVVVVVALAVLGPEGVPRLARGLGKARAEIRRLTADVPPDALQAITNPRGALLDAVAGPRQAAAQAVAEPRLALADAIAAFKFAGSTPTGEPLATPVPAAAEPPTAPAGVDGPAVGAAAPEDPGFN